MGSSGGLTGSSARRSGRTPERTAGRAGRIAALIAAGLLALSGCSLLGGGDGDNADCGGHHGSAPHEGEFLQQGTTEVDTTAGERVQVALPDGSLGVGDDWGVIEVSDPSVVDADVVVGEKVFGQEPSDDTKVGGSSPFAIELRAKKAGEATVTVVYCTRARDFSRMCDQSQGTLEAPVKPVEVTVTVQ